MTADRVPQPGEVWVFRQMRRLGRGFVVIDQTEPAVRPGDDDRVAFRYWRPGTPDPFRAAPRVQLRAFVLSYDFVARSMADLEVVPS